MGQPRQELTLSQVALLEGVPYQTARHWVERGLLKWTRRGPRGAYFFHPSALEQMREHSSRYVYFIQRESDEAIKIGLSWNPFYRAKVVSGALKTRAYVVGRFRGIEADERALHVRFAEYRIPGGENTPATSEWFAPAPELVAFIEALRAG